MKSLANAAGAKTARACDSCVKRRARWYCAADDAFLCQSCDVSVHSANPLARRHERVRLKTATHASASPPHEVAATWHHGFTRKPRTPRGGSVKKSHASSFHDVVPEISVEDQTNSYSAEEQMICQVPVLDPMMAEKFLNDVDEGKMEFPIITSGEMIHEGEDNAESCLNGFFPTDMELEEFTAGMETLLDHGLDTESYAIEDLGLSNSSEMFKIEKDEVEEEERKSKNMVIFDGKDGDETVPFELSFDYEEDINVMKNVDSSSSECITVKEEEKKNVPKLRLNYESVISTWGGQGLPWTLGEPPNVDIDINRWSLPSMVGYGVESLHKRYIGGCLPSTEREARVLRYREKRRNREFSKKIRYAVRKLNAEKRPREKGRFVKR